MVVYQKQISKSYNCKVPLKIVRQMQKGLSASKFALKGKEPYNIKKAYSSG